LLRDLKGKGKFTFLSSYMEIGIWKLGKEKEENKRRKEKERKKEKEKGKHI
jgi:hypothetical protein